MIRPPPHSSQQTLVFDYEQEGQSKQMKIYINEIHNTHLSDHVWPAARALSQFLCAQPDRYGHRRVVELGTGTGVCGLVAAKLGCKVIFTDHFKSPAEYELLKMNLDMNEIPASNFQIQRCKWGEFDQSWASLVQADYFIGSDCFYEKADFENLVASISLLLHNCDDPTNAFFLTSYQIRCTSYAIEDLLKQFCLVSRFLQQTKVDGKDINIYEFRVK